VSMLNQILQPRFSSMLSRYFAIRGAGSPAPTLAPEIAPSFDVNQMDDPPQFYTRGEKIAGGAGSVVAVAAQHAYIQVINPVGSGQLVILDAVMASSAASAAAAIFSSGSFAPTNNLGASMRDSRWVNLPVATVSGGTQVAPLITAGHVYRYVSNADPKYESQQIVLPPGTAFVVASLVVNNALTVGFTWRERTLPNEEIATG